MGLGSGLTRARGSGQVLVMPAPLARFSLETVIGFGSSSHGTLAPFTMAGGLGAVRSRPAAATLNATS